MIIHTKQKHRFRFFRNQEPAILTKKNGAMYLVTGKRNKKLKLIKGPKVNEEIISNIAISTDELMQPMSL